MTLINLCRLRELINTGSYYRLCRGVFFRGLSMDTEMAGPSWRGVPISEIIGSQNPWGAPEFPLISPAYNHTVLYHIPSNGDMDRPPKPQIGQDKWDSDHVRMPCSSKSLYPVEDSNGETHLRKRWEMIEEALRKPILSSEQLADAILSYNTKFKNVWKFRALHTLFNDHLDEDVSEYFFKVTLPQIVQLALDLPKLIQAPIPLLKQHKNHSISLTQHQIASLLANAFFCTFPRRNTSKRTSEYSSYPHINFSPLYECAPHDDILEKLACICHYFRRVCTRAPRGIATFSRRSVPPRQCPIWADSHTHIATLPTHVDADGRIEDAHSLIQLDFANKYLGGGVLGHGCVQEEIRFAICPELMISMLFTEVLRPNEALLMIGCERYSQYTGYGRSFRWAGGYEDSTPFDSAGRKRVAVLAIDALPYSNTQQQFRREVLTRELNKAWVGFSFHSAPSLAVQYPGIATGNWGCGAFGGSPEIKCLIQLMAAAQAKRPMAWVGFSFHSAPSLAVQYPGIATGNWGCGAFGGSPEIKCLIQLMAAAEARRPMAWVGFSFHSAPSLAVQYPGIATGNWGCGAFGGSPEIKCLIQLMAAAEARRPMAYYTFGDTELRDEIISVFNLLARYNVTVGQLYNYILKFSSTDIRRLHLHSYIQQILIDEEKKRSDSKNTPQADQMDASISHEVEQQNEVKLREQLLNESPDLFSQDEDSQKESHLQTNKESSEKSNETPCDIKIDESKSKTADSKNKMAPQTKRLFDKLQKFDEESSKIKLNTSVNEGNETTRNFNGSESLEAALKSSDSDIEPNDVIMASSSQENTPKNKMADSENKMVDCDNDNKMVDCDNDNKMAATSRLFDELRKYDDEQGRLNLSVSSTPLFSSKSLPHDSDASVDSDKSETSEVKKKIAGKITDYFTKKTA